MRTTVQRVIALATKRNGCMMGFTFSMIYKPTYQRRYGVCSACQQGIVAGTQIMIGTGFFNRHLIKQHLHYDCYIEAVQSYAKNWFFKHDYKPTAMAPEKKRKLACLRAKRYYIQRKGGESNVVRKKLEEMEKQIALVKVE